jgi:hypothetical protein
VPETRITEFSPFTAISGTVSRATKIELEYDLCTSCHEGFFVLRETDV